MKKMTLKKGLIAFAVCMFIVVIGGETPDDFNNPSDLVNVEEVKNQNNIDKEKLKEDKSKEVAASNKQKLEAKKAKKLKQLRKKN